MRHKVMWLVLLFVVLASVMLLSFNSDALNIINYTFKADIGYISGFKNLILRTCSLGVSALMCYAVLVFTNILYGWLKNRKVTLAGGGTLLAFLGHEFIMIPLIRIYSQLGTILGFLLCAITSFMVTFILTRKVIVDFFSPLLDLSVLCQKLKIKIYKEQ